MAIAGRLTRVGEDLIAADDKAEILAPNSKSS